MLVLRRHLGWTAGYPTTRVGDALCWCVPDERSGSGLQTVTLGRREVSRAQRTANELRREFPRVLPKLVGDPELWRRRVDLVLSHVKAALHERKPLPADLFEDPSQYARHPRALAREVVSAEPALKQVVAALSWVHAVEQDGVLASLAWVQRHAESLVALQGEVGLEQTRAWAVLLTRLAARLGAQRLDLVMAWLADPRVYDTPLSGGHEHAGAVLGALRARRPKPLPEQRATPFARPLLEWLTWTTAQDTRTAKRALETFEISAPKELLSAWRGWWDALERASQSRLAQRIGRAEWSDARKASAIRSILELRNETPRPLKARDYFRCIETLAAPIQRHACRAATLTLAELPQELPRGAATLFFMHWAMRAEEQPARLTAFLDALRRYLVDGRSHSARRWMRPWLDSLRPETRWPFMLDREVLANLSSKRSLHGFFEALRHIHGTVISGIDASMAQNLIPLLQHAKSPERAAQLFLELHQARLADRDIYDTCRLAIQITGEATAQFAAVVERLLELEHDERRLLRGGLGRLVSAFDEAGRLSSLRSLLLDGNVRRLVAAGQRIELLKRRKDLPAPVRAMAHGAPPWAAEYPEALHGPIARLAATHEAPEKATVALLGTDLPRASELMAELAALRHRADDVRIARRITNLEQRLRAPPRLSQSKLDKLRAKLERAAERADFDAWERQLAERTDVALAEFLGVPQRPEWANGERNLALVAALTELPPDFSALGQQLLRVRCGSRPWDLRDHPANRRFLEQLRARGVNVDPWVDGIGPRAFGGESDPLTLALEDDPLEVLRMGAYFETCLAPRAFNFFSAVTNAADINKRVLYARNSLGQVRGRCLLALTDAGDIVTFHPYCHDTREAFSTKVMQFVSELADSMRVVVVPAGGIRNLVALAWYDDGPVDLAGRFAFLRDAAFLERLTAVPPGLLLAELEQAFAPQPLNELTLPLVLGVQALTSRPELVAQLLPHIRKFPPAPELLAQTARQLMTQGEVALAWEIFGAYAERFLERTDAHDSLIIELLATFSPSRALAVLRAHRKGRTWNHESDGERLFWAAEAHLSLHRKNKAAELYRLSLKAYASSGTKARARSRLAELAPPLA